MSSPLEKTSELPRGPTDFLDRKDKQAGLARLFIVFSPPEKQASKYYR